MLANERLIGLMKLRRRRGGGGGGEEERGKGGGEWRRKKLRIDESRTRTPTTATLKALGRPTQRCTAGVARQGRQMATLRRRGQAGRQPMPPDGATPAPPSGRRRQPRRPWLAKKTIAKSRSPTDVVFFSVRAEEQEEREQEERRCACRKR